MDRRDLSRRTLLASGGLSVAAALAAGGTVRAAGPPATAPGDPGDPGSPWDALDRLLTGNRRFAQGRARRPRQDLATVRRLATDQRPYAVVLGCADSRVPPEVLFDQGLGDLFDNRLAGNVVDDLILGSVEFAVHAFGSPLVVVLGHERCGAVAATVAAIERGDHPPHHVGAIVDALRPIVAPVLHRPGDPVENGCRANVNAQVRLLYERSPLLADRVDRGGLLIVGAHYDLDDGRVSLVDEPQPAVHREP